MNGIKNTLLGLFFTFLWSSAAVATKFGLYSAPALTIAVLRFFLAGGILLLFVYLIGRKYPWPKKEEWLPLLLLGLLNTTIYLGGIFWALQYVSAGLFNLFVTTNPFIVALLSYLWLNRKISAKEGTGMVLAALGLLVATGPALFQSQGTVAGVVVVIVSILSMAIGSVYFKKVNLQLPGLVINTWQIVLGGVMLAPVTWILEKDKMQITWDMNFWGCLLYLVFVISIGAMLLWFYLLKQDAVRANNWLFMTPIFGYILAAVLLQEPVSIYDGIATIFVVSGLYLSGNIELPKLSRKKETTLPESLSAD